MKREMKVYYATGDKVIGRFGLYGYSWPVKEVILLPSIKIENNFLYQAGFKVGDKIEVEYGKETITIRKL